MLTLFSSTARAEETYHMVLVPNPDQTTITTMLELGLPMDDSQMIKGEGLEIPLEEADIALLQKNGISHRIIQRDLEAYYAHTCRQNVLQIPAHRPGDPVHMKYGSMGGFYNFNEIVVDLDSMHLLFPNLITEKDSIGTGHEGNPIWMVKVSDNPNVTENEPSGVFDALHHAREPGSYTVLMYAIWYLLENYGTDPECTYLINNRELYFVPVVNPDGFLYNIQTNPGGGGMWRKNRRNNGGGIYGVDLNRNYTYQWGYDNQGSSPNPSSSTYRGPSAGSEPETQTMMGFISAHNFRTGMTIHSSAGVYLTAYGYDNVPPDPLDVHMEYLAEAARFNGYDYGTCYQIMYASNGRTQDWQLHDEGIINIEPEVGHHGFWPSIQYIMPEAAENLHCCLNLFWCAGGKVEFSSVEVADGYLTAGSIDTIIVEIMNRGWGTSEVVNLNLATNDPFVTLLNNTVTTDTLLRRTSTSQGFRVQVAPACSLGHEVAFTLIIDQGGYLRTELFTFRVGTPMVCFEDDVENGIGGWTHEVITPGWVDQWHLSDANSHSPTHAWKFGDTGSGNYANHADGGLVSETIDIGISGELSFWHWIEAEASGTYPDSAYDGGVVEISNNSGPWAVLPMFGYTHHIRATAGGGNPYTGPFIPGTPVFSGTSGGWVQQIADLSAYPGDIQLRFRFGSDGGTSYSGWYLDDVLVTGFPSGTTPYVEVELTPYSAPIQIPASGGSFSYNATVTNNTDITQTFYAVLFADIPNGSQYGPIDPTPYLVQLPAGASVDVDLTQNVPGNAPAGVYTYYCQVGTGYNSIIDSSGFTFTKLGTVQAAGTEDWISYYSDAGVAMMANDLWTEDGIYREDGSTVYGTMATDERSLPEKFTLHQNYPNPFNPVTTIRYDLPQQSQVTLVIYDMLGREVKELVRPRRAYGEPGELVSGMHCVVWNGTDSFGRPVSAGIYLYRLEATKFTETKKLLLLK